MSKQKILSLGKRRVDVPDLSAIATPDIIDMKNAIATPVEQLEEITNGLNIVQQLLMRRHIGKLRMSEAKEIAAAIGKAVVESTTYKLTLSLDLEKKRTFACYMRSSAELQQELQRLEGEFRNSLANELLRVDHQVAEYARQAETQVNEMKRDGLIDEDGVQAFKKRYSEIGEGLLTDNRSAYATLVANFKELLTRTLTLFMSEVGTKTSQR